MSSSGPDDPPLEDQPAEESYPWTQAAVLPEDRAMGLELELIELEHERAEARSEGARTAPIDAEIDDVRHELEDTVEHLVEPDPPAPVEIHAPEAGEADRPDEQADGVGSAG